VKTRSCGCSTSQTARWFAPSRATRRLSKPWRCGPTVSTWRPAGPTISSRSGTWPTAPR
jgi:hypothetical protein